MRTDKASAPEEANLTCPLVTSVQSAQDEATHANSRQYQDPLNTGMGPVNRPDEWSYKAPKGHISTLNRSW